MIIAGRYELGEQLGRGGEARVYRARDIAIDHEVALRLSPTRGTGRPPLSLSQMPNPHPGWVRLLDCGIDEIHGVFTVFELLRGETLGAMVARGTLPVRVWHHFVRESLDAVGALHDVGWVHGDLNADNFLLHDGTTWKLLELPFHQPTVSGDRSPLFGSIYTMAPEQFAGRTTHVRSDLYALGCLYYAAASGVYPHAGGSEADVAIGRLRFPATPLHERAQGLRGGESAWVMQLLATEPADRPADVAAARQLLMRTQDSRPIPGSSSVDSNRGEGPA
jgi:serine/threonine protein kinase